MHKILLLLEAIPGWMVLMLSHLFPRDRNIYLFGVHTASFSGNIKAILLEENTEDIKKIFIGKNKKIVDKVKSFGIDAYCKYSINGIWYILRGDIYIYSSYPSDINFWLSGGAKYINVWHGTPIKKIERDVTTGKYSLRNKYEWIFKILKPALLIKPDVLLVSSTYEEKCFLSAFDVDNNSLYRVFPPRLETLIATDTYKRNKKHILYTPTWRDDHSFDFSKYIDLKSFNDFLRQNSMIFYIKLHPSDRSIKGHIDFSNIETVDQNEDIYAFLRDADILVSDYSSMVFEALYLFKPVVLFCPDYKKYQRNSREFYIDPCEDLPVEASYMQKELENKLLQINKDATYPEKFRSFEPYAIVDNLLEKLIEKAYRKM